MPNKRGDKRDYKKEYARDQSSTKRKKYRASLTKFRRKNKGGSGKDAIHSGGKIVGYGSRSKNRQDGARKAAATKKRNNSRKKR